MYVHICRPQYVHGKPYPPASSFISKFTIMEDFTEKMWIHGIRDNILERYYLQGLFKEYLSLCLFLMSVMFW